MYIKCVVVLSHVWLFATPMDCSSPGSSVHRDSPGRNTGVGCHALLQGIFPTQGSNPGLLPCRQILYHLSREGSPRILVWVVYPFSRGSSQPRNRTSVSCIAGRFFTSWATREAQLTFYLKLFPLDSAKNCTEYLGLNFFFFICPASEKQRLVLVVGRCLWWWEDVGGVHGPSNI